MAEEQDQGWFGKLTSMISAILPLAAILALAYFVIKQFFPNSSLGKMLPGGQETDVNELLKGEAAPLKVHDKQVDLKQAFRQYLDRNGDKKINQAEAADFQIALGKKLNGPDGPPASEGQMAATLETVIANREEMAPLLAKAFDGKERMTDAIVPQIAAAYAQAAKKKAAKSH